MDRRAVAEPTPRTMEPIGPTVHLKPGDSMVRPPGQNLAAPRPLRPVTVEDVKCFLRAAANAAAALIR